MIKQTLQKPQGKRCATEPLGRRGEKNCIDEDTHFLGSTPDMIIRKIIRTVSLLLEVEWINDDPSHSFIQAFIRSFIT